MQHQHPESPFSVCSLFPAAQPGTSSIQVQGESGTRLSQSGPGPAHGHLIRPGLVRRGPREPIRARVPARPPGEMQEQRARLSSWGDPESWGCQRHVAPEEDRAWSWALTTVCTLTHACALLPPAPDQGVQKSTPQIQPLLFLGHPIPAGGTETTGH